MSQVPQPIAVRRAINLLLGHEKALIAAVGAELPKVAPAAPDTHAMSVLELCLTMTRMISCGRAEGLSVNGMLALLYIHSQGKATLSDLREAGIVRDNGSHMATVFRRGSFNVGDVLDSVHSGDRGTGRYFSLNAVGVTLVNKLLEAAAATDDDKLD